MLHRCKDIWIQEKIIGGTLLLQEIAVHYIVDNLEIMVDPME